MTTPAIMTPLERSAIVAAFEAPNHTLRRMRGYFVAAPRIRTSGNVPALGFTKRLALRLQRADLVQLDDIDCPSSLSLTDDGIALAKQLLHAANEDGA